MYEIATNKEVFVALSLTRQRKGERRTWDVRFTQDLNDWEVGSKVDFLHFLENNIPLTKNGDRIPIEIDFEEEWDLRHSLAL